MSDLLNLFLALFFVAFICRTYIRLIRNYSSAWKGAEEFSANNQITANITKVSVILAARNEEANILNCLHALINQDYPASHMEVIVVDDNSEDATVVLVKKIILEHPHLKIRLIELKNFGLSSKKIAIAKAIDESCGDLILSTDADCIMESKWIKAMVSFERSSGAKLLVAPVLMLISEKQRFLEEAQQLDSMSLVMSGAASLYQHKPLVCNGANLAFRKSTYQEVKDEIKGNQFASGDDMFLMLAIHTKYPESIRFVKSKAAIVKTAVQPDFVSLLNQRKRWITKGLAFENKHIASIGKFILLYQIIVLTSLFISFFKPLALLFFLILFLSKTAIDYFFLRNGADFFSVRISAWKVLTTEFAQLLFAPVLLFSLLIKGYYWKNRKLT